MSSSSEEDVLLPTDTDSKEATNAAAAAGGNVKKRVSQQHHGPMFTAIEDLLVAKAYIKASENAITGNKQKLVMFYTHLGIVYDALKKEQEEEEKREAEKPSHLRVPQLVALVVYPEWTGSSIYQHFNKNNSPSVIKYMGVVRHVRMFNLMWESSNTIN